MWALLSTREHNTSKEYTEYSLMNKEAIVSTLLVVSHVSSLSHVTNATFQLMEFSDFKSLTS